MSARMKLPMYTVDAFSDVPFQGNQAAVCLLSGEAEKLPDTVLQKVAAEMNLSETAFIRRLQPEDSFEKSSVFNLRWFTPIAEIKLCGHATLASAAILFREVGNQSAAITFKTLSGDLIVKRDNNLIHMDFPVGLTQPEKIEDNSKLIEALGEIPEVQDVVFCQSLSYLLVRLKDGWNRSKFEQFKPQFDALEKSTNRLIVLIVTTRGPPEAGFKSASGAPYDFVSRCFAPWTGILEDPVTGSAQTVLAHYWSQHLGKTDMFARQCSARGGEITVRLRNDRVELLGYATVVMEGKLRL